MLTPFYMRDQCSRTLRLLSTWYLATGCEEHALPYVSIREDLSPSCMLIVKKVSPVFSQYTKPQTIGSLHWLTKLR